MAGVFVGVCEWPRRARVSRRGAWSCEFSSSMGAGMWSPRTPRTRRACLGGGGGARLSSVDPGATGQARGGARFSTLTRDAVCCCVAVDGRRESVWSALCCWTGLGSGHGGSLLHTASRHPCVPSSKINGFKAGNQPNTNHAEHRPTYIRFRQRSKNRTR